MPKYEVTATAYLVLTVEADSEAEAKEKAGEVPFRQWDLEDSAEITMAEELA